MTWRRPGFGQFSYGGVDADNSTWTDACNGSTHRTFLALTCVEDGQDFRDTQGSPDEQFSPVDAAIAEESSEVRRSRSVTWAATVAKLKGGGRVHIIEKRPGGHQCPVYKDAGHTVATSRCKVYPGVDGQRK